MSALPPTERAEISVPDHHEHVPLPDGVPPTPSRRWWTAAIVAFALAMSHFVLLLAWLLPGGVPPRLRGAAHVYLTPLFVQNWWLFAPDPPAVDRRADVRGAYTLDGRRHFTRWLPLTAPLTSAVQRSPLSPRNAPWIMVLNATYALADPTGPLRFRGAARDLVIHSWSDPARQPLSLVVLERTGSLALAAAFPELEIGEVQVRVTVRRLPPFEARSAPSAAAAEEIVFPPVPRATDLPRRHVAQ